MENSNYYKELDSAYIMNTYGRYDVVIDHGKNATLFSADNKKYIDFASGIGTLSLGTANKGYIAAINNQLVKVQHMSNYFYSEPTSLLAEKIIRTSSMSKVFFCNSGAEANEGAIKLARKYSFDKYGTGRSTILTFNQSFHGRTVTTLAATGQEVFHNYFFPFTPGFKYCEFNNPTAFVASLTGDICAVMLEVIQGEGGVNILDATFAKLIADECAKRDILVIIDEVQTGIGRTGTLYASQGYPIKPNIMTLAKGLAGGLPIGTVVADEKCSDVFTRGMHGSTFGGNPVSSAAANYVLSIVDDVEFLNEVSAKGEELRKKIKEFNSPVVSEVRGKGLMIGVELTVDPHDIAFKAIDAGLIVLTAGKNVLRLLPPLTITSSEMETGLKILKKVLS